MRLSRYDGCEIAASLIKICSKEGEDGTVKVQACFKITVSWRTRKSCIVKGQICWRVDRQLESQIEGQ
jgi:hypothetical protein